MASLRSAHQHLDAEVEGQILLGELARGGLIDPEQQVAVGALLQDFGTATATVAQLVDLIEPQMNQTIQAAQRVGADSIGQALTDLKEKWVPVRESLQDKSENDVKSVLSALELLSTAVQKIAGLAALANLPAVASASAVLTASYAAARTAPVQNAVKWLAFGLRLFVSVLDRVKNAVVATFRAPATPDGPMPQAIVAQSAANVRATSVPAVHSASLPPVLGPRVALQPSGTEPPAATGDDSKQHQHVPLSI